MADPYEVHLVATDRIEVLDRPTTLVSFETHDGGRSALCRDTRRCWQC